MARSAIPSPEIRPLLRVRGAACLTSARSPTPRASRFGRGAMCRVIVAPATTRRLMTEPSRLPSTRPSSSSWSQSTIISTNATKGVAMLEITRGRKSRSAWQTE